MIIKTKTIEVTTIQDLLVHTRGNQSEVARMLDVTRTTLRKLIKSKAENVVLINTFGGFYETKYTLLR